MAFILNKSEHTVGDSRCTECYKGYPLKCVCGGLIHSQFVKETWDGDVNLSFGCDNCGDKYEFPGQKPKKKLPYNWRRAYNKRR